jgi:hypothetical protein
MWGERFPCQYRLTGILNRIIFGTARRLASPPRTREEHLRASYGPSRRLVAVVVVLCLLTLLALVHLIVLLLHGPILPF